ncbi:hypothetical protein FRB96_007873 [Tulasnella sp. 330]|nr:hypothetical protein FRB96_007873 [Tulasnella sp. 330]
MTSTQLPPIPVTVFTGFLGSGKTTIILGLLPQLPKDYRVVLLKNDANDTRPSVDSQLAKQSSLAAVSEILNGCMCCVLVGQMKTALLEIRDKFRPDRIIIESSGSAFPATLAFQIRELERDTKDFKLDAILTVIDAENFTGYEDTSVTAKMQAQYSDVLLVNKAELVSERQLDTVMDHLYTLNEDTPKIRCIGKTGVVPSVIFGMDSKLGFEDSNGKASTPEDGQHNTEVETATIWRGASTFPSHANSCDATGCDHSHHAVASAALPSTDQQPLTAEALTEVLTSLPKESIYRVKGFVMLAGSISILNWAFGRWDLTPMALGDEFGGDAPDVKLTIMGPQHLKSPLPDIGNLANWTVSSCKYGFNVSCLRDNDPNTYWQSDGPQPHYVTLQFQKKIAVQRLAIYLNFDADDSYTPTKLLIRAGTGLHDLQDIKSVSMEQPRGWIQFDVGSEPEGGEDLERMRVLRVFHMLLGSDTHIYRKPLFMYVLQVVIAANHQNGKDTHVRGLAVLGPKEMPYSDEEKIPFKSILFKMHEFVR